MTSEMFDDCSFRLRFFFSTLSYKLFYWTVHHMGPAGTRRLLGILREAFGVPIGLAPIWATVFGNWISHTHFFNFFAFTTATGVQ